MRALIKTTGEVVDLPSPTSIERIRTLIGAETLDTILLADRIHVMILDDLGHSKGLPTNILATHHYWTKCGGANENYIVGDVIVVPDSDFGNSHA